MKHKFLNFFLFILAVFVSKAGSDWTRDIRPPRILERLRLGLKISKDPRLDKQKQNKL